eukprot:TRINITY_DN3199_c0_g1_i1.p1 TRINITY_DN3199_c0_g1~~TRINITY_DN3199_c0_g1_i1.p1  ORF type:complete len:760 (+),score=164.03 TRINITY_DN3199_c0_g1_i1:217-2280(+)
MGAGGGTLLSFGDEDASSRQTESYSSSELSDIYQNCIKLSAQGKISVKNTWNLPLIGQLNKVLDVQKGSATATPEASKNISNGKKKSKEEARHQKSMCNFQMASCTLEASVKIYSTRVDSVHSETYKVMGGLSRTNADEKPAGDSDDAPTGRKERTRSTKVMDAANTLESNPSNLNSKNTDVQFDVKCTQLFQKTSAAFDEGGARGLLLNQIGISDSCHLLFESDARLDQVPQDVSSSETVSSNLIAELLDFEDISDTKICPSFSHFEFSGWSPDQPIGLDASEVNEAAELAPRAMDDSMLPAMDEDDIPDLPDFDFCPDDYDGPVGDGETEMGEYLLPDANSGGSVASVDMGGASNRMAADMVNRILSSEGDDFSYFNDKLLKQNWAGPSHWKLQKSSTTAPGHSTAASKRAKKQERTYIDFEAEDDTDYAKAFERPPRGGGTRLTETTLKRLASVSNELPDDVQYDITNMTRLFCKPHCRVRVRAASPDEEGAYHRVEWYDYQNDNDTTNFCHKQEDPVAHDDDDGFDMGDFEFDTHAFEDEASPSAEAIIDEAAKVPDVGGDDGIELITAPEKVEALTIKYDKVAKKVDVRNLKQSIWTELVQTTGGENATPNSKAKNASKPDDRMQDVKSFTEVLNVLPRSLPQKQRENVSVPFAFICLLHLANEKGLDIQQNGSDLQIQQGL